jgi:hypothetical protein
MLNNNGVGETLGIEPSCCVVSAIVAGVGEHDPLAVGPSPFVPAVDECHEQFCPEKYNSDERRTD